MRNIEERKQRHLEMAANLRSEKIRQTKLKMGRFRMDTDDYHYIAPPDDYHFEPIATHPNGDFYGYLGWGINMKRMLETLPPVVQRDNSMAGNFFGWLQLYRKTKWNPDYEYKELEPIQALYDIDSGIGQTQHFAGDVRIGFKLGWGGLLKKVKHYARLNIHDGESADFYSAEEMFLQGVDAWIQNTIDRIGHMIEVEEDDFIRENLVGMKEANEWIRTNPPRTLREACQFMCWYNMAGRAFDREGAGGQLDEWLRPYYEQDVASGLIDDEEAIFYLMGLLMSDTKYYQLGGPNEKTGKDMVSRISWLVLEAAERLNVASNLTIRVHDDIDQAFFRHSVGLLFQYKNGWPRYSGDASLVKGFTRLGYSKELARNRICVGCNWMAMPGIEYCMNDSVKVNLAKIFEVAYYEMMEQETSYSTQKLWKRYAHHLAIALDTTRKGIEFHLAHSKYNVPELFLNLFCDGPVEKGLDASNGGVSLYNIGIDGVGIATVADSFAALEQRIEKEGRFTWEEMTETLKNDFNGECEAYIQQMMLTANKYGQQDSRGLHWAKQISQTFSDLIISMRTDDIVFIPGLFSWSLTIRFGEPVGAMPCGRKAKAPLNHGANPMPGSVKNGAMTTMSSSIAAIQPGWGNTAPFQVELDPGISETDGGIEKVMALLKTHLDIGGTLINVNIVDAKKILEAHADPMKYPDLVVRVTGFTAYFMTLSPEFRQLVVDRLVDKNG